MNHKTFRILLVAYMILILGLSSLPAQDFPKTGLLTWLLTWDKLIHLVEYFILGILAMKSMNTISYRTLKIVLPFGMLFGGLDEYLQSFISGRFSSEWDVLADTIGVAIGALLILGNDKE